MNNKVLIEASKVSFTVVLLVVLIGLLLAMGAVIFIGFNQKKRYRWLEGLFILPMFIPPSAIGYIILMIFGRQGWIGRFLYQMFDISIIFTLTAAVIAGIVVTFPIMYQSIKAAVLSIDEDVLNAARVYGASELTIWIKIIFPLSIQGILNGMLLSFARAFGEFGATILVAGNIPGKTQTLPMALYYAIENNDNQQALLILVVIFIVAIFLVSLYKTLLNYMRY
ncbi:molybdate ABC transporter permease subunit [Turicibacter sp. TJ11]|uniref:molybdate ABC transporter permease subunit n=1 Tax=Turicibacter sp. TJ11 TaxID=2806443 RepID=UPI001F1BC752|nr:molybdate ABC transporter permease subunit [Turicibacter sp. TJ11]